MNRRRFNLSLLSSASALGFGFTGPAWAQSAAMNRIAKEKVLRVGWAVWHPYVFRDPKASQVTGIAYDLIEDLAKSMGVKAAWVEDSWSTLPAGLQASKYEITNLMAITPPRAEALDFSEPVTKHGLSVLASKATVDKNTSWDDWNRAGVRIAVTLGSNTDLFVTERFKNAEIVRLKTVPETVLALVSGRVHGLASTIDALKTIQKEHPTLVVAPGSYGGSEVAFGVPKGDTAMATKVNEFVRNAKKSGRIKELLDKYGLESSFAVENDVTYEFQFEVVTRNLVFLLSGIQVTLLVTAAALSAGLVLGLFVALARMSENAWLRSAAVAYVEVFRNTPALIQLMWVYYCLPILTGLNLEAATSATLALAVNGAAYIAEIIRGGIQGVDRGQAEAARTLGMSKRQALQRIILPQAFRRMIPPFVNEAVSILKFSSLVSVLGVADLTYQATVLSTTTFRPIEIFSFIAIVYFCLCTALSLLARRLELRLSVSD